MQALVAPMISALAGPVAAGTAATTAATALQMGAAVAGGVGAMADAKGQAEAAKVNAFIGRTRAMQTDVSARQGLDSELATIRATLGANGQRPGVGTAAVMDTLRSVRARDRRIEFGNQMQLSADYRTQGRNAGRLGGYALAGGLLKAGPSLFDLYELRKG